MPYSQSKLALAAPIAGLLMLWARGGATAQQFQDCETGRVRVAATVTDRVTGIALKGAAVNARWHEGTDRQVHANTDSAGRALLCIPPQQTVTFRSTYDAFGTKEPTTFSFTALTGNYAGVIDVPGSMVRGRVLDMQSGAALARVSVRLRNTGLWALTDTAGRFVFERIPVGEYQLRVEHIAYATNDAPLRVRDDDLDALVRMTPAAIPLQPIVVTAFSRRLDNVGFYERRKRGVGTFFDRKQIDGMNVQDASDLLRRLPNLKLVPQLRRGSNQQRNATVGRRGNCRYTFVIDGSRTLPDFEMDFVAAGALEGVEVYNGLAEVPAAFKVHASSTGGSTICGVIAVWTRDSR
jgi:hypothetical protein